MAQPWDDIYNGLYDFWQDLLVSEMADDEIKCDRQKVDTPPEKVILERRREWEHGKGGLGKDCADQKITTPPEKVPDTCHRPFCSNDEWYSVGILTRDKKTKKVLDRSPTK